jgi:hypothetical protein
MNTSMNKTMKRSSVSNISTNESNPLSPKNSANSQKTQKPVYLFYRTPSNKDNKKIEFKQ